MGIDYKSAGVDIEAGYSSVALIKKHVKKTYRNEVLSELGGFGGMFSIAKAKNMENPVLVSGTDSAGTKVKIAFLADKHDTIGIDAVAMCVNDVVCCGAEPLFFLDYIACGKNYPEKIEQIVKGIADGCIMSNCSLVGGETAEMPGVYDENEYDVAGFAVGIVEQEDIIDGKKITEGDVLIGLASNGIHSNGYSLVRKILTDGKDSKVLDEFVDSLGETLGEALLRPTRIYVKAILSLIGKIEVKGISNITGGGFIENIPRSIPDGFKARVNKGSWKIPPVFDLLKEKGGLTDAVMYNTFNMGIGMVLVTAKENVAATLDILSGMGETAYEIGEIIRDSDNKIEIL